MHLLTNIVGISIKKSGHEGLDWEPGKYTDMRLGEFITPKLDWISKYGMHHATNFKLSSSVALKAPGLPD